MTMPLVDIHWAALTPYPILAGGGVLLWWHVAWWAGVTKALARAALVAMEARVIEIDGLEGEQWATDEIIPDIETAEPTGVVRLLPVWDTWLMSRRERSRVIEKTHQPYVVDRSGNVTNTITLDGRVIGVWDVDGETVYEK